MFDQEHPVQAGNLKKSEDPSKVPPRGQVLLDKTDNKRTGITLQALFSSFFRFFLFQNNMLVEYLRVNMLRFRGESV